MSRETTSAVPNPGSAEAKQRGCRCPVIDNCNGRGWNGMEGCFVYVSGCPLHWPAGSQIGPFTAVEAEQ